MNFYKFFFIQKKMSLDYQREGFSINKKLVLIMVGLPARGKVKYKFLDLYIKKNKQVFKLVKL